MTLLISPCLIQGSACPISLCTSRRGCGWGSLHSFRCFNENRSFGKVVYHKIMHSKDSHMTFDFQSQTLHESSAVHYTTVIHDLFKY